jgi:hypothetical protein
VTDHIGAGPGRHGQGDARRAGRDVKDAVRAGGRRVTDHRAAPAAILAERQEVGEPVVASRKTGEHAARHRVAA